MENFQVSYTIIAFEIAFIEEYSRKAPLRVLFEKFQADPYDDDDWDDEHFTNLTATHSENIDVVCIGDQSWDLKNRVEVKRKTSKSSLRLYPRLKNFAKS